MLGVVTTLILTAAAYSASAGTPGAAAPAITLVPAAAINCVPTSDPVTTTPPTTPLGGVFAGVSLNSLQVATASTVVQVATNMHITRRGIRIALAVAMQESSLNPAATNGVYVGLFQQRTDPKSGLYTQYNRLNPTGATTMFFQQLTKRVPGYETDARLDWQIGEVVQETNVGRNVEQWFGLSEALTARLVAAPVIQLIVPATKTLTPVVTGVTGRGSRGGATAPALRSSGGAFAVVPADFSVQSAPLGSDPLGVITDPLTSVLAPVASAVGSVTGSGAGQSGTSSSSGAVAPSDQPTVSIPPVSIPSLPVPGSPGSPTSESPTSGSPSSETSTSESTAATTTTTAPTPTTATSTPVVATTTTQSPPPSSSVPTTTSGVKTTPKASAPVTTAPAKPTPITTAPTTRTTTTAPATTTPVTTAPVTLPHVTVTVPVQTTPPNVTVNPDPPEPPVPTNGADPSVGPDPSSPPATEPSGSQPHSATPNTVTPNATPNTTPAPTGTAADCAPATGGRSTAFDPGMIISDAVFYNTGAMSAADIRTFINNKGVNCTAAACLRLLRVTTPSKPADRYCAAYQGGTNEDVAAVLQRLSVACRINPQVMLVTLQKESALLTRTDVTMRSYDAMYGWHCPDSGPGGSANCDPQYAGFFNQAYGMAKQWARYRVDPQNYNYQAGRTQTILWNVAESGCGGSSVFIRNTATASLYDYTPYQPNAASLAAYPGVGDRCSSYGNRNFFFLFQKYFGTTGGGVDQNVGLNGVKVTIPTGPHVAAGAAGAVITAPTAAMAKGLAAGFAAVGLPYVYGGGTNGGPADQGCSRAGGALNSCQGIVGFDCSGLTAYVLMQAGARIPTYSGAQRSAGKSVPWTQGKPGDIIGYEGHVAIYLGVINGTPYLMEAPDVGMFVQIRPVYYSNHGIPVDSSLHRYWG